MKVAFYAPLKAPDHPVPSGDRKMARLLITALERAGHQISLVSSLRAYLPDPSDIRSLATLRQAAADERDRISADWQAHAVPDLWFCYHPYYKSPDLIGPPLAAAFGIPWVSAEASLSARRRQGIWSETQAEVQRAVEGAAMNFAMTVRDRAGITELAPTAHVEMLAPFLDTEPLKPATGAGNRLICVAMMRPGDKLDSYRALAAALALLPGDWHLAVAGDGLARDEVQALFPLGRVDWHGELPPAGVAALLRSGAVYVWPGCGEAYGLAYLEAQAAGLPIVAWATAGVPEVVVDGETGILAAPGDIPALASAITTLLADPALRHRMGVAARDRVLGHHGLATAARRLNDGLRQAMAGGR